MALVALVSAKGAPGVTTLTVALAALSPGAVAADLDPDGGDLALRYRRHDGAPLDPEHGLLSLAASLRREPNDFVGAGPIDNHLQVTAGGLEVLLGVKGPDQAIGLGPLWSPLARALAEADRPVFADCGRVGPASPSLPALMVADAVIMVARAELEELAHLRERLRFLIATLPSRYSGRARVGVIMVAAERDRAAGPRTEQLLRASGVAVPVLGTVAEDARGAAKLRGLGNGRAGRTTLIRSVRSLLPAVRVFAGDVPEVSHLRAEPAPLAEFEPDAGLPLEEFHPPQRRSERRSEISAGSRFEAQTPPEGPIWGQPPADEPIWGDQQQAEPVAIPAVVLNGQPGPEGLDGTGPLETTYAPELVYDPATGHLLGPESGRLLGPESGRPLEPESGRQFGPESDRLLGPESGRLAKPAHRQEPFYPEQMDPPPEPRPERLYPPEHLHLYRPEQPPVPMYAQEQVYLPEHQYFPPPPDQPDQAETPGQPAPIPPTSPPPVPVNPYRHEALGWPGASGPPVLAVAPENDQIHDPEDGDQPARTDVPDQALRDAHEPDSADVQPPDRHDVQPPDPQAVPEADRPDVHDPEPPVHEPEARVHESEPHDVHEPDFRDADQPGRPEPVTVPPNGGE